MKRREFLQGALSLGAAGLLPGVGLAVSKLPEANSAPAVPTEPIWDAALKGNWETVKRWLTLDPSLIAVRGGLTSASDKPSHYSLLHLAARDDNIDAVKYLVSCGADVNDDEENWRTPLFHAAFYAGLDVVKYLVSHGADVHAKSQDRTTILHLAAGNETEDGVKITQYLAEQGCDVDAKDRCGATPLLMATSWYGDAGIIKYHVEQGADVNAVTRFRSTPLYYALTVRQDVEIIKYLISHGADVNAAKYTKGYTPLYLAVVFVKDVELVKYMVSQGADIQAKTEEGSTPLDAAREKGLTAIAEYLASVT